MKLISLLVAVSVAVGGCASTGPQAPQAEPVSLMRYSDLETYKFDCDKFHEQRRFLEGMKTTLKTNSFSIIFPLSDDAETISRVRSGSYLWYVNFMLGQQIGSCGNVGQAGDWYREGMSLHNWSSNIALGKDRAGKPLKDRAAEYAALEAAKISHTERGKDVEKWLQQVEYEKKLKQ